MKLYKRILATILFLAITLTLFAACGKEEETAPQGEVSDMSGEQHFHIDDIQQSESADSNASAAESSVETPSAETPSTDETHDWSGEFIITEKKYEYKEKNFMLLNVTNDTGKNCNLTITGTFYDESGNVVRIQQQLYRNHPTGWSNYFIFYPDMKFDTFTYEVSAEEYENNTPLDSVFSYNGEPLSDRVTVGWIPELFWRDAPGGQKMLMYRMTRSGTHLECETKIFGHVLFLDENGEVFALDIADQCHGDMTSGYEQTGTWPHMEDDPDYAFENKAIRWVSKDSPELAEPLPDVKNFTLIFAIQAVVDNTLFEKLTLDGTLPKDLTVFIPTKNLQ